MRAPFTTSYLSALVAASPTRIWRLLTSPDAMSDDTITPDTTITSAWRAGSPVCLEAAGCAVFGQVLRSVSPHRLTYTLGAPRPDGAAPSVIVTWEVRPAPSGDSLVELTIDDLVPGCEDDELSATWHTVLCAVKRRAEAPTAVSGPIL